jgi:predicted DNA-binding transcriptional regulator YafY
MVQRTEIEGVLPVSSEDALTVEISVESSEIDFIASNRDLLSQVGKNRYQLEVFQDEWIIRSVLSEAAGLQLLKPTTVRDAVKKRAEDALHLYGR